MENENISIKKIIEIIKFTFETSFKVEIYHDTFPEIPRLQSDFDPTVKVLLNGKFYLDYNLFELMDLFKQDELNKFLLTDRERLKKQ